MSSGLSLLRFRIRVRIRVMIRISFPLRITTQSFIDYNACIMPIVYWLQRAERVVLRGKTEVREGFRPWSTELWRTPMKKSYKLGLSFPDLWLPVPYVLTVKFNRSLVFGLGKIPGKILVYRWIKSTCFTKLSTMHCIYALQTAETLDICRASV